MSLSSLIKSLKSGEVLLPRLKQYLAGVYAEEQAGTRRRDETVIRDAKLAAMTFKRRLEEYNHKPELDEKLFHPSSLGSCLRRTWLKRFKAPLNNDAETIDTLWRSHMTFETGTYVGVMFQNLCSMAGFMLKREVPISDKELGIIGHADALLKIDGKKYVLEIKTINSRSFAELKKRGSPDEGHLLQITAYMGALSVFNGLVVYLEKDTHQAAEYPVEFDKKAFERDVVKRIRVYFDHVKRRVPPPMEGDSPSSKACRWCRYTHLCYSDTGMMKFKNMLYESTKKK